MSYSVSKAVGRYYEKKLAKIFGLIRLGGSDKDKVPDLATKTRDFYLESKASQRSNGGVIKKTQLLYFDKVYHCPYAFSYHPLKHIAKRFTKKELLFTELNKNQNYLGTYIFPIEIVKSFYPLQREDTMKYPEYPDRKNDDYVQMTENEAKAIFDGKKNIWNMLGLKPTRFKKAEPHEKIHILYRKQHTLDSLMDNFNPKKI